MDVCFFNSRGDFDKCTNKSTAHKANLVYLKNDKKLSNDIGKIVIPILDDFFESYSKNPSSKPYKNSGELAEDTCNELNIRGYEGIVGSFILDYIQNALPSKYKLSPDTKVRAIKDKSSKKFFHYFLSN